MSLWDLVQHAQMRTLRRKFEHDARHKFELDGRLRKRASQRRDDVQRLALLHCALLELLEERGTLNVPDVVARSRCRRSRLQRLGKK